MSIMRRETTGAGACFRARVDPLGLRPLFVRRIKTSGDGSIVSCRIGELVRADDTIDPLGLATLLTLGFPLADRTLWCEIRRVEAGEQVDASTGGRVGLLHAIQPQQRPPTDDELHEVFMEALRTSIGSNAPIVLLSGGRDSRLIYLGLRALGIRPRTMLTSGRFGASADARVAARLASAFGDPIEEVPLAPFSMETELWRHRAQSFESLEHGWRDAHPTIRHHILQRITDVVVVIGDPGERSDAAARTNIYKLRRTDMDMRCQTTAVAYLDPNAAFMDEVRLKTRRAADDHFRSNLDAFPTDHKARPVDAGFGSEGAKPPAVERSSCHSR